MWFYVDDKLEGHNKVRKIPRKDRAAALGLWVLAGSWCARMLSDGWLPEHMIDELCGTTKMADALVSAGLWAHHKRGDEPGFVFVDWAQWQKTREQVEKERASNAKRQATFKERRKGKDAGEQGALFDADGASNTSGNEGSNTVTTPVSNTTPQYPLVSPGIPGTEQTSSVPAPVDADAPPGAAAEQAAFDVEVEVPPPPRTSQTLVKEWIDRGCGGKRPPGRVVGHVSRELSVLLNRDEIPYEIVREGLARWHDRRLSPSVLASIVYEVQLDAVKAPAMSPNGRPVNGSARPGEKTTERLRALEAMQDPTMRRREITQ